MTNKECAKARKYGLCHGMCDQCTFDGHKPRKEFGIPQQKKRKGWKK